ncbi:MAG TPA: ABC transporter ATP-binding protein [Candidatus Limiplasma sp.]|nr:ABC transporter ATP-binding protein [Candidatus Limiplasma sp.]HPS80445.1 ABC transporter ATP-binding protein [Candidatus Limiplasma sp.]
MLQVTHLSKVYHTLRSVNDLSFTAESQEAVGLLGPNGAGKSTTMRMLAGYLAPTSGEVELCGLRMADRPRDVKRMIGYLPELPPLYPESTVTEHLRFVCALKGVSSRDTARECERVCGLLNLSAVSGRVIGRLSKGYRQRVGFAAALIGQPRLLILDEPTVGLDPQQVVEIRRLILDLAQQMTVLISSHMLSEIACVCAHLLILNRGVLVADGSAQSIAEKHRDRSLLAVTVRGDRLLATETLRQATTGQGTLSVQERPTSDETDFLVQASAQADLSAAVFQAVAARRDALTITSLCAKTPSLEDIFMEITRGGASEPAQAAQGGCGDA